MASDKSLYTPDASPSRSEEELCQFWLSEIESAGKREKDWLKDARETVEIYEGEGDCKKPFNILYSNSETLSPAIYNSSPRPDVRPRYRNDTDIAIAAAGLCESYLTFFVDSGDPRYAGFDDLMIRAVLNAIVPGRGCAWYKYDGQVENDAEGQPAKVRYETICGEEVSFDQLLEGYGRTWQEVPWIARIHFYSPAEAKEEFKEKASQIKFFEPGKSDSDEPSQPKVEGAEGMSLGIVYEVWNKAKKEVLYITPGSKQFLRRGRDELNLEGFFPTPEPLKLFRRISSNVPQTLYSTYEEQAKELNRVTIRIQRIIEALKVRGFYDSQIESIAKALHAEDNVLLPAQNIATLQGHNGKLEDAIFTFPIEKLVTVLQQLYLQREQIKQVIYEITGISDILRGASIASETATAQNLKDRWGSLRLRRFQKEVARYVRDSLRIVAEIAFSKLAPDTIRACTGSKLPSMQEKAKAQAEIEMSQAFGQPPPPQAQQILATPSFEECLALLQSDLLRRYNIDIEANSTVDAEATEDKKDIGEFMTALSQLLSGLGPLIQDGVMPFEAAKTILLAVVKRYRFGREVEEQIKSMAAPQGQKVSPEELEKKQEEIKQTLQEVEDAKRDLETQQKVFAAEVKVAKAELQAQQTIMQAKMQAAQAAQQAQVQKASIEQESQFAEAEAGLQGIAREIKTSSAEAESKARIRKSQSQQPSKPSKGK